MYRLKVTHGSDKGFKFWLLLVPEFGAPCARAKYGKNNPNMSEILLMTPLTLLGIIGRMVRIYEKLFREGTKIFVSALAVFKS